MPRNSAVKKKQIVKKAETLDMRKINWQIKHQTHEQKARGKVLDEMSKGINMPTVEDPKRVVEVRASWWLDIVVKRERTKKGEETLPLTSDEKRVIKFYEERVRELMAKK